MFLKISNTVENCQIKLAAPDAKDNFEFSGYASVFNGDDSYGDTILPGAYSNAIAAIEKTGTMPFMFFNHRHFEIPPGDWLKFSEDKTGLASKGLIDPLNTNGPSLFSALKRGALTGMSVGIKLAKDDFELKDEDDEYGGKIIKNVTSLLEVSIVTMPADDNARISNVKSILDELGSIKECENFLREVGGFSKAGAADFVGVLKRHLRQREAASKSVVEENTKNMLSLLDKYSLPDLFK